MPGSEQGSSSSIGRKDKAVSPTYFNIIISGQGSVLYFSMGSTEPLFPENLCREKK
jgi:hypothetical protein